MLNDQQKAKTVLIVSSKAEQRETLAETLWQRGWNPSICFTAREAAGILRTAQIAAVLCDDVLSDGDFRDVESRSLGVPVIVVSRRDEWEPYPVALAAGATDYLAFPPYAGELQQSLARAVKVHRSLSSAA